MAWTEQDDFIAFSFGDFNTKNYNGSNKSFIRTSDGDRYNQHLTPQLKDKTAEVPGGDGQYYFGTDYGPKVFDVSFAFQGLTKAEIQGIKKRFSGKEIKELCFAEESDRIYMAKVTSQPSIKMLAFGDGGNERYNGEGTVQFTAYWPYARDPKISNEIPTREPEGGKYKNNGDIPAPFIFTFAKAGGIANSSKEQVIITIGDLNITIKAAGSTTATVNGAPTTTYTHYENIKWDSKTGIVSTLVGGVDTPIPYTGNSLGGIAVGETQNITIKHQEGSTNNIGDYKIDGAAWKVYTEVESNPTWVNAANDAKPVLKYHYWYY